MEMIIIRNYSLLLFIMIHITCTSMLFLHEQRILPFRRFIVTGFYTLILMCPLLYYAPKLFSVLSAGDSILRVMEDYDVMIAGIITILLICIKEYKLSGYTLYLQKNEQADFENWISRLLVFLSENNISNNQVSYYVDGNLVSLRFHKVPHRTRKLIKKRLRRKFSDVALIAYIIFIAKLTLGICIYYCYFLYM